MPDGADIAASSIAVMCSSDTGSSVYFLMLLLARIASITSLVPLARLLVLEGLELRVAPQPLQLVVVARRHVEHVHDHIDAVQEYPALPRVALNVPGLLALFGQAVFDGAGDGRDLDPAGPVADDEEVTR
jgi:hypothetical protein